MPKLYSKILLPAAYFPPVLYFACLMNAESAFLERKETYVKQTYRNRCNIYAANGKLRLSVPVIKVHGNHTKTEDMVISSLDNWKREHWRALESSYNSSPFFLYYADALKPYFHNNSGTLYEYNIAILETLTKLIGLEVNILETNSFEKSYPDMEDFRDHTAWTKFSKEANFPPYHQVFGDRYGFIPNLSILDLLFNEGPNTPNYLASVRLPE